jgi:hypothetical protein
MIVKLKSTKAIVTDVKKVRDIFDTYTYTGVDYKIRSLKGKKALELIGPYDLWPEAIKADLLPSEDKFDNQDDYDEAWLVAWGDKGEQGFQNLLIELAAYLETPLLILVASIENGCTSQTWLVEPGCKDVRELCIGF